MTKQHFQRQTLIDKGIDETSLRLNKKEQKNFSPHNGIEEISFHIEIQQN